MPAPANQQLPDAYQSAPAHVSIVDGRATLEREGRPDGSPLNAPLLGGDRLRTADGRVEVVFGDGVSTLHLDSATTVDVESDDLLRLIDGRVRLNLASSGAVNYRVDSPAGSVRISQPGEYRIALLHGDAGETQLELAVVRGVADIFTDQGSTPLHSGQRGYASVGLAPSYPYTFNSANWDAFDQWSETQRSSRLGVNTQSAQYLPADIQTYAPMLEENGDWQYNGSYGYVWYPRVVSGWRPYYYGRWASYPRYGWTWIGTERWAWPTHHYGRWGFSAGGWFWIPGSYWAPAYVSWGYAPGYVSWCPLGFDNHAVFSINVGFGWGGGYYSPWYGWTAMPRGYFGHGYVHEHAQHFEHATRGHYPTFQSRPGPPAGPAPGVGRRAAATAAPVIGPSRGIAYAGAGRPAVGSSAPRFINNGNDIVRSQAGRPRPPVDAQRTVQPYGGAPSSPSAAIPRGSRVPMSAPNAGYGVRTTPMRPGIPPGGSSPAYSVPRVSPRPYNVPQGYYNAPRASAPAASAPQRYGTPTAPSYGRPMPQQPSPYQAMPPRAVERPGPPAAYGHPGAAAPPRPSGGAPAQSGGGASAGRPAPSSGGGGHAAPRGGRGR